MKKLFTLVVTLLLGATLSFAQTGGDKAADSGKADTTTKGKKHHHGKKGGKKGKKGSAGDSGGTTAPK
jgi:hypothetical protein